MPEDINTVTVYRTWVEIAETLKPEDAGRLMIAVCKYALDGIEPDLKAPLNSFFSLMKPSIDKSNSRKKAQRTGLQKRLQNGLQNGSQTGLQNGLQNGEKRFTNDVTYIKEKEKEKEKEKNIYTKKEKDSANTIATSVDRIVAAYPESKGSFPSDTQRAVITAINREMDEFDISAEDAIDRIEGGLTDYKAAIDTGAIPRRMIMQPGKFFSERHYATDWSAQHEVGGKNAKGAGSYGGYQPQN